jgi:hypothetical protein
MARYLWYYIECNKFFEGDGFDLYANEIELLDEEYDCIYHRKEWEPIYNCPYCWHKIIEEQERYG